jgi:phosphoenolpyruvate carboxylase
VAPGDAEGGLDPWHAETDAALRSDIRRLGDELGRTLVRQVGSGLLARVERAVERLEIRPVVTAPPTEASRRSVLGKLADIGALLVRRRDPRLRGSERDRIDRRTAELIDLLWVTDELRLAAPRPTEEAQATLYPLEAMLFDVLPALEDDLRAELRRLDVTLPIDVQPMHFGSWVGGDRDGNPFATPEVTAEVLAWMHERGLQLVERALATLVTELSPSSRIVGVSPELAASLEQDRELLPRIWERLGHLNAEEPYRLKLSYCLQRVQNTRERQSRARRSRRGARGRTAPCSGRPAARMSIRAAGVGAREMAR